MNALSRVFVFKIAATVLVWCLPLLLLPLSWLQSLGLPVDTEGLFLRLLAWAYLGLCLGYGFGLRSALEGKRALGPIWVGILSNAGACLWLLYFGLNGIWVDWHPALHVVGWGSILATAVITWGLWQFGLKGQGEAV